MKKLLSIAVAVSLLGYVSGVVFAGRNHDDVPGKECQNGRHTNNPHCEPSVSPSVTATPTPEITQDPCQYDAVLLVVTDDEVTPCESPTVTPTVTVIPTPTVVTPQCAEDEHLNLQKDKCLKWEHNGSPQGIGGGTPFEGLPGEDAKRGANK